ncbi:HlyD family type I secretion periplasmic adaptor subunit [Halovulum sp. GXIMD14793]
MSDPFGYRTTSELVQDTNDRPKKVDRLAVPFQPDAVEVELRRLPFTARFALYTILFLLVSAIAWAWWAEIDRTVTARGKLISQSRTVVKQPYRSSVIRSLNVRPGDVVARGDMIASLDPTLTQADQGQIQSRILRLQAEWDRLEAERLGTTFTPESPDLPAYALQIGVFDERRAENKAALDGFAARIEALGAQYNIAAAQEAQIDAQLRLARQKLETAAHLAQSNITSEIKRQEAEAEVARLEAAKVEKAEEQQRYLKQQAVVEAERRQYQTGIARQIADRRLALTNEIEQLEFELQKAQRFSDFDVFVAESDGIVMDVTKKSVGSVVEAAEVLFTLVPIDEGLDIELELTARDIGWVVVGQPVRIKLDPFPFQRHGTLEGTLTSISPDAFQRQVSGRTQVYYQARVSVGRNNLRNLPDGFSLLPGITTTAEIRIGKRTVLSYITDPFHKALDESLKEPT